MPRGVPPGPGLPLDPARDAQAWFEGVPAGLLTATAGGSILRVNPTLARWTGQDPEALHGRLWFDVFLSRAGRLMVESHIYPLLRASGRVESMALDLLEASGRHRPALLYAQAEGEVHRVAFLEALDRQAQETQLLEARRLAEDTLEDLRALGLDLERRVEARTAELAAANQILESFAQSVAHDLRAPLQVILGLGSLPLPETPGALAEAQRRLELISRAGGGMKDLISALLDLARNSQGPLRKGRVDLTALAERIREEGQLLGPGPSVRWEIQPGLEGWGDEKLLDAVLRNLLGNAVKYSSRVPAPQVRFFAEGPEGERRFCVADNGAGFDMKEAARLFQPFQRLQTGLDFPGLGIGLSTVKRILERHGGTLAASGAPGEGAVFRFTLPGQGAHGT